MKSGHESTIRISPLRGLVACVLASALGAAACNGDIMGGGGVTGSATGNAGATGNPGTGGLPPVSTGTAGTPMMNPPVTTGGAGMAGPVDVGRVAIHRLNNLEYDNTIRDLVGVDAKTAQMTFQPDEKGEFDNDASAFTMNDARYEQYFNAADSIGEMVFANAALKAKILTCVPANPDTTCTSQIISKFALRAWRRPLVATEVTRLVKVATDAIALGETPENSIKQVVKTLLASPQFLYRIEYDANPAALTAHALDPYELATRLSYLGWSSMPDDMLFSLAQSGQINNPVTITAQIDRMLADPAKGNQFTESFAGQWLGAREMKSHQVEPTAFKTFDEPLRDALVQEQYLYFNQFLKGALPMTKFFTTDANFVNARSAMHYGFPAVTGTALQPVTNTSDTRVGFMGLASFLTLTSFSYRTAPTLRGKWVLENLLCEHIPMPPANVPLLDKAPPTDMMAQSQNVRTKLAMHRTEAACAACHAVLDPIGLGLENFDAIGTYRQKYANNETIDSSGVMPAPGNEMFKTVAELATILSQGKYAPELTNCTSQKMMTYALSRSLVPTDAAYLDQVRTQWSAEGYGLKSLLKNIVLNDTFRWRRGEQ